MLERICAILKNYDDFDDVYYDPESEVIIIEKNGEIFELFLEKSE